MGITLDWPILMIFIWAILLAWVGAVLGWAKGSYIYALVCMVIGAAAGAVLGWYFGQHLDWFGIKKAVQAAAYATAHA